MTAATPPNLGSSTSANPANQTKEGAVLGVLADGVSSSSLDRAFLGRVCRLLVDILPMSAAGFALVDQQLRLIMASAWPEDVRGMVIAQFARTQGPCVDVCRSGQTVTEIGLIASESPHWAVAAWRAVHTLPLHVDGGLVGCLTLASAHPGKLTEGDVEVARRIGAIVAAHAYNARALASARQLAAELERALQNRVVVEQAKGVLASQLNICIEEALVILRWHARTHDQQVAAVAGQVVTGNLRLSRLEGDDPSARAWRTTRRAVLRPSTGGPVRPALPGAVAGQSRPLTMVESESPLD